jgi:hypothetical protein
MVRTLYPDCPQVMIWIATRFLLLPLLVVAQLLPTGYAGARTSSGVAVSTISHGIRLTLVVPRHTYPRNALVQFSVIVQNVSHYTVLTSFGPFCGLTTNPSIEVSNGKGQLTPQLPSVTYGHPCSGVPTGLPLLPGQTTRQHLVGVVSGAYIRSVLHLGHDLTKAVDTPRVQIRLTAGTPLTAAIHRSNIGPYATVRRPSRAMGPLYFVESAMCGSSTNFQGLESNLVWSPILFHRIYSGYAGPQDWHGLAGYINYPVATIHYTSP